MEKIFQDKRIVLGILIALGLLVYLNSLNGAFVSDDIPAILQNPLIGKLLKSLQVGGFPGFILSLDFVIGKTNPFVYHLTNLLLHLVVVILTYFLLLKITTSEISFLASAIFAVHPIHAEAVSWISGRPYLLGTILLLASLWFYISSQKDKKLNFYYYFASLICFFLAQYAEIKSIAFLFLLGLYELSFGKISSRWKRLIPFFILTLIFFGLRFQPFQARVTTENPEYAGGLTLFNPFQQIPVAISSYLELFIWPLNLSFYHEDLSFSLINFLVRAGITLALFLSLIYFYRKEKLLFFGFLFFILSLIPTLLPIHIAWIVAERYVYLGSIGLCLVLAWILVRTFGKYPRLLMAIFWILILLFSVRTTVRNRDWKSHESLWIATVKTSPTSPKAWNNMGDVYAQRKDFPASIEAFQRAIELRPNYVDPHHNIGVSYLQMGEYDKAIAWFEKAIAIHPIPQSYNDMGIAYYQKNDWKKAEECFKKALELDPKSAVAYNSLGIVYHKKGMIEEARQAWLKALELEPFAEGPKRNLMLLEKIPQSSPSPSPQR